MWPADPAAKRRLRSPVTAKKDKKAKKSSAGEGERIIAQNRKARHNYAVLDTLECGIVLRGSEVKSARNGKVSLSEAYGRVKENEVWLVGCDIAEYVEANQFNHEPRRPRKLLLHRREIERFAARALQQGLTLVPLKMYFKRGRAKVLMGICQGQKRHDKREAMKKAEAKREMARQMQRRQ
jgi:SsrA-binding protein